MRKLKLLLTALTMLVVGGGNCAWAGTVDCTSKMSNSTNDWTGVGTQTPINVYNDGVETYQGNTTQFAVGDVLYQTISELANGYYKISFYAWENYSNWKEESIAYGNNIAQVFANSSVKDFEVIKNTGGRNWDAANTYTLLTKVTNGTLKYGVKNIAAGGNWAACKPISLTYLGETVIDDNTDLTCAISNPSFETGDKTGWIDASDNGNRIVIQNTSSFSTKDGTYFADSWWWDSSIDFNQTTPNLPAGRYRITVNAQSDGTNEISLYAKAGSNEEVTEPLSSINDYNVIVSQVTTGSIKLGIKGSHVHTKWVAIDNFRLTYLGIDLTELKSAFSAKQTTATSLLANSLYDNVVGTERTTLDTKKSVTPEESTAGWTTAVNELQDAIDAFMAAKPNYDEYAEANAIATTLGATTVTVPTTAEEALTRAHELNVNIDTKVSSTYLFDVTATYAGTWTGDIGTTSGEHWKDSRSYLDNYANGNLSNTQTLSLPAGNYVLKMAGRGSSSASALTMTANAQTVHFRLKGNTGVGIDLTGAANFASTADTYTNGNNGRGWEWRFIPLTLAEPTDVTVTLTIERSQTAWASLSDFTILMNAVAAEAADYAALATAISAAEGKTLGFETGEYAPYNNVGMLTKLAYAKTISSSDAHAKQEINDLTTMLSTEGNWNANSEEVNAFNNNGNFIAGKLDGIGWQKSAWVGEESNYVAVPNGTYITYGALPGFEIPLKASTLYGLQFRHSGWDGSNTDGGGTVSVLLDEAGLTATNYDGNPNNNKGTDNSYKSEAFVFTTGEAGNYVFTLTGRGGRTTVKDFSIKKAPETISVTVTSAGMATFCSAYPLDFTGLNVKAYTASLTGEEENKTVLLTRVYQVPANTGLVLRGDANTYTVPVIASAETITGNLMMGTLATTAVDASTGSSFNYMLSAGDNGVGFYKVAAATTSAAGKAYLHTDVALKDDSGNGTSRVSVSYSDEEATGIADVKGKTTTDNRYYNLQGQRVLPTKGLYIKEGKKVIIK